MKKQLWNASRLLVILVFSVLGSTLTSCEMRTRYTVWTASDLYSEYQKNIGGEIKDGYYYKLELTKSDFAKLQLTNENKHRWTEDKIYSWFIGRGFGSYEANALKSWLLTTHHGFVVSRSGGIVYLLVK